MKVMLINRRTGSRAIREFDSAEDMKYLTRNYKKAWKSLNEANYYATIAFAIEKAFPTDYSSCLSDCPQK